MPTDMVGQPCFNPALLAYLFYYGITSTITRYRENSWLCLAKRVKNVSCFTPNPK